jgi:cytidine deaminase
MIPPVFAGIHYFYMMEKRSNTFSYEVYDSESELPGELASLMKSASEARSAAYAPYSNFSVGAAVLLANGKVVIGSNQENAAYPSGLCAERVAVFSAASQFPGVHIKAIAIAVSDRSGGYSGPVSPCGNCRQVMAEYEHRSGSGIKLVMPGKGRSVLVVPDVAALLPFMFTPDHLPGT